MWEGAAPCAGVPLEEAGVTRQDRLESVKEMVELSRSAGAPLWEVLGAVAFGLREAGQLAESDIVGEIARQETIRWGWAPPPPFRPRRRR